MYLLLLALSLPWLAVARPFAWPWRGPRPPLPPAFQLVSEVVVLGDSYSDDGRLFAMSNGTRPDPQWYWFGRYSDGPTWPEYLYASANALPYAANNASFPVRWNATTAPTLSGLPYTPPIAGGVPLKVVSLAVGGSPACEKNKHFHPPGEEETIIVPWLDLQVNDFQGILNRTSTFYQAPVGPPAQRAVVVQFGGNDYLNQIENISVAHDFNLELKTLPEDIVRCIQAGAERLLALGEKNLILFTLPAVDRAPQFTIVKVKTLQKLVERLVNRHNAALREVVAQLQANHTDAHIYLYDLGNATSQILDYPEAHNFTNVKDACLQYATPAERVLRSIPLVGKALAKSLDRLFGQRVSGRCMDEEGYAFYDRVHPTTHLHSLLAQDVSAHLQLFGLR